jgi:hypothetical protein
MELLLKRIARRDTYTIGKLYVNGAYVCDTIEDRDRLFFGQGKIKGVTAIPRGRYEITQNIFSPRFGCKNFYKELCGGYLPRLLNVPLFDGVLIHCGNQSSDTEGCILVGRNTVVGKVTESQKTFTRLMKEYLLPTKARNEKVYITIE